MLRVSRIYTHTYVLTLPMSQHHLIMHVHHLLLSLSLSLSLSFSHMFLPPLPYLYLFFLSLLFPLPPPISLLFFPHIPAYPLIPFSKHLAHFPFSHLFSPPSSSHSHPPCSASFPSPQRWRASARKA